MGWLPDGFEHPERLELPTGHHLRPIRADDVDIDYPAVMGSRERLWAKYGEAWGWPPATMSYEADREDLAHHEAEIAGHETFNYAILDEGESELLGCVYIDPPDERTPGGSEAVVSWWVVDALVDSELERALAELIPSWLSETWRFRSGPLLPLTERATTPAVSGGAPAAPSRLPTPAAPPRQAPRRTPPGSQSWSLGEPAVEPPPRPG
jgi:hypothetical protein